MIVTIQTCPHCQSERLVKNGHSGSEKQRAKCKDCQKTFTLNPASKYLSPEKEALIQWLLEERTTIRGICRAARCGTQTIYAVLKKSRVTPST
jgi:predicted Zn finger-like uncharacterized protein